MSSTPYEVNSMRFGSPLIDKKIYDTFKLFFNGIAIELTNGKKYVTTIESFDKTKGEVEGKYYTKTWKVF